MTGPDSSHNVDTEIGGGLVVTGAAQVPGATAAREKLIAEGVPGLLAAGDPTLWGPEAESEARIRLGWLDTFKRSREFLPRLAALRAELREAGLDHIVLAGMGGSSLAPEVITRTLDKPLTVLDTTDPQQVLATLRDRLDRTVVVVSSKSGGTVETTSHLRAYHQAFLDHGLSEAEAGGRIVVVTDPGSPLEERARQLGVRALFLADPYVGGRYSALTAFGLVPSALAGVDVEVLLDEAAALASRLAEPTDNPALALGAALGAAALAGRDKVALADDGSGIVGLGDWIEQLLAESTGKNGTGILPVVLEDPDAPGNTGPDVLTVTVGGSLRPTPGKGQVLRDGLRVNGPLGAQFLAWEFATAIAGRLLGINPFDQPNVTESKNNTNRLLEQGLPTTTPDFTEGAVEVYLSGGLRAGSVAEVFQALSATSGGTYLAIMAYLDRYADREVAQLRSLLARVASYPVTFGWGPRFLHSTGQYHKGGPTSGVFLQITGAVTEDLPVPGVAYTFGQLQAAQAAGDLQALASRGRPVARLHLTDRAAGITQLLAAARSSGGEA